MAQQAHQVIQTSALFWIPPLTDTSSFRCHSDSFSAAKSGVSRGLRGEFGDSWQRQAHLWAATPNRNTRPSNTAELRPPVNCSTKPSIPAERAAPLGSPQEHRQMPRLKIALLILAYLPQDSRGCSLLQGRTYSGGERTGRRSQHRGTAPRGSCGAETAPRRLQRIPGPGTRTCSAFLCPRTPTLCHQHRSPTFGVRCRGGKERWHGGGNAGSHIQRVVHKILILERNLKAILRETLKSYL